MTQPPPSAAPASRPGGRVSRILIIDDHPIVRRGLAGLINDAEDLEVCGEADTLTDGLRMLRDLQPHLALVDLSLGDGHGLELIKQARTEGITARLLVVSMMDESLYADRVLRAGAEGYLRKEEASENIITAIRDVLIGKVYLSPTATARVLTQVASKDGVDKTPIETLSDRELEVFELLGNGLASREIADRLELSVKTVETYREKIKSKLSLKNGTELTRHAIHYVMDKN